MYWYPKTFWNRQQFSHFFCLFGDLWWWLIFTCKHICIIIEESFFLFVFEFDEFHFSGSVHSRSHSFICFWKYTVWFKLRNSICTIDATNYGRNMITIWCIKITIKAFRCAIESFYNLNLVQCSFFSFFFNFL